jgi:hypothetical protein
MTLEVGNILHNRYKIKEIIAKGGMGAIYLAEDETLGIHVALKENLFSTEEASRQFRREATILASLRHPNLPRVSDHFIIPDQGQYLVMDFIEGEDLRQRLAQGKVFSEDEVIRIGVAICDALSYLHNRQPPVVHRDIKPGNVKITSSDQVYLVDFGLAKVSQPGQATTTGAQALTPGYASPEQYGQGTDPRSDIYSLGATLYAALTNTIPEDALSRAMGTVQLSPIRKINAEVSERTEQVIERAMEVSLKQRYQTVDEFKQALQSIKGGLWQETRDGAAGEAMQTIPGGQAPVPPSGDTIRAGGKRKPSPIIWIAAVVVLAIIGVGAVLLLGGKGGEPVSQSPTETKSPPAATRTQTEKVIPLTDVPTNTVTFTPEPSATATPEPTATETLVPFTSTPTATGGGKGQIAFVSDRSGSPQIFLINSDGQGLFQVTNAPNGACEPNWSPDGTRLVFISPCKTIQKTYEGASLFVINADGTGFQPLKSMPGGDFDPAWSPDGNSIAFASVRDGISHIFLYNLVDGSVTRLTGPSSYDRMPTWSPDGEKIAFVSNRLGRSQIFIMNKDGSAQVEFSNLEEPMDDKPDWAPDGTFILFSYNSPAVLVERMVAKRQAQEVQINVSPAQDGNYSRDGYWIAYEGWGDSNHEIYIMLRGGTNVTRLTNNPGYDYQPVWRP